MADEVGGEERASVGAEILSSSELPDPPAEATAHNGASVVTTGTPPDTARRWRRRVFRGLAFTLVLLAVAAGICSVITLPEYAISPGSGLDVAGLISVGHTPGVTHRGKVLLTDVDLTHLSALSWVYYHFVPNAQIVPAADLVGPDTPSQYDEQGTIDMALSKVAATVAGLHALGYPVRAVSAGAVVYQPFAGAPATRTLHIGDVVTAIGGRPTLTFDALLAAVRAHRPGARVEVKTHQLGSSASSDRVVELGEYFGTGTKTSCLAVGAHTTLAPDLLAGHTVPCLGFAFYLTYRVADAPFHVSINSDGIVGPSAGLAFTLGLIEKLDRGDLTGGQKIAATGTMSVNGAVGDVGGVAQKTIAVRATGAALFFVPPQEYRVAKAHAGRTLRVLAVSTLAAALADLRRLGGEVSPVGSPSRS